MTRASAKKEEEENIISNNNAITTTSASAIIRVSSRTKKSPTHYDNSTTILNNNRKQQSKTFGGTNQTGNYKNTTITTKGKQQIKQQLTKQQAKKQQQQQQQQNKKQQQQQQQQRLLPPSSILCPITDEIIHITNATLQDIKLAKSLCKPPWFKSKQYLVTVPSSAVRQSIYDTTAAALVDLETKLLPTYGGRTWQCIVTISDDYQYCYNNIIDDNDNDSHVDDNNNDNDNSDNNDPDNINKKIKKKNNKKKVIIKKNSNSQSTPYFIWNTKGQLEIAALPNMIQKIPNPPRFPGFTNSTTSTSHQNKKKQQEQVTDEEVEEDNDDDDNVDDDQVDLTDEELYWKELQEREITNISTLAYNEHRNGIPLPHITVKWISPLREMFRTRVAAYEHAKKLCHQEIYIDRYLYGYNANGQQINTSNVIIKPPTRIATYKVGKLRFERDGIWIIGQEQSWQKQRMIDDEISTHNNNDEIVIDVAASSKVTSHINDKTTSGYVTPSPPPTSAGSSHTTHSDNDDDDDDNNNNNNNNNNNETIRISLFSSSSEKIITNPNEIEKFSSTATTITKILPTNNHVSLVSTSALSFVPNYNTFCLNEYQIKLCYDAGIEHYDQILRTVTARDLTQELQDGFDLLRQRGKGRFDMNLPQFDNDIQFSFLNDMKKTPWISIVKQILGNDVVLIHKGIFISMPGCTKQDYHQDGLHLNKTIQKPCHAINVFIPLVDLTTPKIGPTEFCLGSHILGNEAYRKEFVYIPEVKAGNPIIFDYRLGHRGLANTSKVCRPIVYCTYAPAGTKEFRDSINFSKKRYHKIGDLISKQPNRMERAEKRQRTIEETILDDVIQQSKEE